MNLSPSTQTGPSCPTCGLHLLASPYKPDLQEPREVGAPCYLCTTFPVVHDLAVGRAKLINDLAVAVPHYLALAGVPKRLRTATWENTTPEIKEALLDEDPVAFARGCVPAKGWGLTGAPGVGKSGANAGLARRSVTNFLAREITGYSGESLRFPPNFLVWTYWPDAFAHLQANAIDPETPAFIDRMKRARVLVLDDLARERFPKDHGVRISFGHDALFQVINYRNGMGAPILWTSNQDVDALMDLYDAPIITRLFEDNTPIELSASINRRLS